jgi:hypothetical protein
MEAAPATEGPEQVAQDLKILMLMKEATLGK